MFLSIRTVVPRLSRSVWTSAAVYSDPKSPQNGEPVEPLPLVDLAIPVGYPRTAAGTETTTVKRSRLQYQSRKRGMLENCLLLGSFAAKHLPTFGERQLDQYDELINSPSNDWDIYYWATGARPVPDQFRTEVMQLLQEHASNPERELRATQPPLFTP